LQALSTLSTLLASHGRLLLPASAYGALRPYPASHPLDRRARCDVAATNPALDDGVARSRRRASKVTQACTLCAGKP